METTIWGLESKYLPTETWVLKVFLGELLIAVHQEGCGDLSHDLRLRAPTNTQMTSANGYYKQESNLKLLAQTPAQPRVQPNLSYTPLSRKPKLFSNLLTRESLHGTSEFWDPPVYSPRYTSSWHQGCKVGLRTL